jgi:methylmalonyl-CoA/ethylmalonyl-CoA epimerase
MMRACDNAELSELRSGAMTLPAMMRDAQRGPGMQQLAHRVSNLEVLTQRLHEQGIRLIYEAPRRGTANSRVNFIHPKDASGVLIELVEPAAESDAVP